MKQQSKREQEVKIIHCSCFPCCSRKRTKKKALKTFVWILILIHADYSTLLQTHRNYPAIKLDCCLQSQLLRSTLILSDLKYFEYLNISIQWLCLPLKFFRLTALKTVFSGDGGWWLDGFLYDCSFNLLYEIMERLFINYKTVFFLEPYKLQNYLD